MLRVGRALKKKKKVPGHGPAEAAILFLYKVLALKVDF